MLSASVKAVAGVASSIAVVALAQTTDNTKAGPVRSVKGQTIFSQELPKAELTIAKRFRFAGTQRVNLYGNAETEQYLFV